MPTSRADLIETSLSRRAPSLVPNINSLPEFMGNAAGFLKSAMFLESSFPRALSGPELMLNWDLSWPEGETLSKQGEEAQVTFFLHNLGG